MPLSTCPQRPQTSRDVQGSCLRTDEDMRSKPRGTYKVLGTIKWEDDTLLTTCILLDTGASPNLIRQDLVPESIPILEHDSTCRFVGANESRLEIVGKLPATVCIGLFRRPLHFIFFLLYVVTYCLGWT